MPARSLLPLPGRKSARAGILARRFLTVPNTPKGMYVKYNMRSWALPLVLLAAALCWQPNAKADEDRDYWRWRHDHWRHRDYNEDRDDWRRRHYGDWRHRYYDEGRADRYDWRRRHYGDWRERRERWRYRHHRRQFIQAGPVTIERY
jgi:hypothetical protein